MDYQAQKIRLIMQLRRNGITNAAVLSAIEETPRELFVPETFADQAYEDRALPIDEDQTISQPTIVALMTEALALSDRMMVLEIGTGSGYQAAILARLCRRVHTIERHKALYHQAKSRFEALKLHNVTTHLGDGSKGWPHAAPYDRIIVTAAAMAEVPGALFSQLSPKGVLIAPIEKDGEQQLMRYHFEGESIVSRPLCRVQFVPLIAAA